MHFILSTENVVALHHKTKICDINKTTKIQSSRVIHKNITKQKSLYSIFINIEGGD